MKKYILVILSFILLIPNVFAYEDCIISTNGKLTDIKIQRNDVIDVFPLITVMNDKNTLIVHPLKEGFTKFSVLRNKNEKFVLGVNVSKNKTEILCNSEFEVLTVDCPPVEEYTELDLPQYILEMEENKNSFDLDEPPVYQK